MRSTSDPFSPVAKSELANQGTEPIPAEVYHCPKYFELERDAIFKCTWLQLGHVCELPDDGAFIVVPVEVAKTSILITRVKGGELRAFHNVCPHRGTRLVSDCAGRATRFTCPYHAWTFANDGRLLGAPDADNFYFDVSASHLPEVAVDVCGGFIFVNLQREPAQTLRQFLGDLAPELQKIPHAQATTFSEYTYEVQANWKLTYDNFQENYHLRFIHPRSGAAAGGPDNPFGYPESYAFSDPHRTQTIWSNPNPPVKPFQAAAFGALANSIMETGGDFGVNTYFGIFPNLFVLGKGMTPFSQCIMPIAANRTRSIIRLYWSGDDDSAEKRFGREYATALAMDIHSEDRDMIERGQQGLESGAISHIHFQSQEVLCRHLYNQVDQKVRAYQRERGDL
ncbi:MAG: aromatic ring-hydroxylating dioxygenase subunit alpha [Halieaceae bacterium]|nr:aromatic ring-hydroxylating dioxygenase subunit alpha [Halieaceae bacterium]